MGKTKEAHVGIPVGGHEHGKDLHAHTVSELPHPWPHRMLTRNAEIDQGYWPILQMRKLRTAKPRLVSSQPLGSSLSCSPTSILRDSLFLCWSVAIPSDSLMSKDRTNDVVTRLFNQSFIHLTSAFSAHWALSQMPRIQDALGLYTVRPWQRDKQDQT